jgi:ribosomal protein S18 acetylase RimI-like enzyme
VSDDRSTRLATPDDAPAIGRLLDDFNTEFEDDTPGPDALANRMGELLGRDDGELAVLLVGDGPDGLAVLRFRPALFATAQECYLAELYVVPAKRGQGLGRALMNRVLAYARERGATHIDLNTEEDDRAARALYESLGFSTTGDDPDGPVTFYYELEL